LFDVRRVTTDRERRRQTIGKPELSRLVERLRRRLARGLPLTGTCAFLVADDGEREALAKLFGRRPPSGRTVSVDLDALGRLVRNAGLGASLEAALEALVGPIENVKAARDEQRAAWAQVYDRARARAALGFPALEPWIARLDAKLLKQLARGDVTAGESLLTAALAVFQALPSSGTAMTLAELAARATGSSHALDRKPALSKLRLSAGSF
jgi:uncharacterized protein (TIGR02679 family)